MGKKQLYEKFVDNFQYPYQRTRLLIPLLKIKAERENLDKTVLPA